VAAGRPVSIGGGQSRYLPDVSRIPCSVSTARASSPAARASRSVIALGGLLPFDDGRWLRSPGMAFVSDPGGDFAATVLQGLAMAEDGMGQNVAPESFLHMSLGGRQKLPRRVVPADSPREAVELLREMQEALRENGLVQTVAADDLPDEVRVVAHSAEEPTFFQLEVDEPVAEWMQALGGQARIAGPRRERATKKKQSGKRKKGKRR
jgi:hypothetical protein